jgi:hypothetical protein
MEDLNKDWSQRLNTLPHLYKIIAIMLITLSNGSFFACNRQDAKPTITFPITLIQTKPIVTGHSPSQDEHDKFSCNILNISWPENAGARLWRINSKFLYSKSNDPKEYTSSLVPTKYFSDTIKNPYLAKEFEHGFAFPEYFPDKFIKKLVKHGTLKLKLEKATAVLVLKNTMESLEELGRIADSLENIKTNTKGHTSIKDMAFYLLSVGWLGFMIWLSWRQH